MLGGGRGQKSTLGKQSWRAGGGGGGRKAPLLVTNHGCNGGMGATSGSTIAALCRKKHERKWGGDKKINRDLLKRWRHQAAQANGSRRKIVGKCRCFLRKSAFRTARQGWL